MILEIESLLLPVISSILEMGNLSLENVGPNHVTGIGEISNPSLSDFRVYAFTKLQSRCHARTVLF